MRAFPFQSAPVVFTDEDETEEVLIQQNERGDHAQMGRSALAIH